MVLDAMAMELATTFVAVASVSDVPPGWVLRVTIEPRDIALANADGAIYAFDNACSHAAGPLGDNRLRGDCLVECPWHNSVFDVRTGDAVRGPARKPLRTYPVKIEGDTVFVALT
jgi:nitrite reductase/ring-hydroxylating ferredoxin subunit